MNEDKLYAGTLLAGTHSPEAMNAEFGALESEDQPIALPSTPAELDQLLGSKIIPTAAIQSFLTGSDILTHDMIDQMETALENHYGLKEPYYVTSMRDSDKGKVSVRYFYFERMTTK